MQSPRLEISQRIGLMMTPMMQQAVALLLMSTIELEQHVEQELETNPTLELVEPAAGDDEPAQEEEAGDPAEGPPDTIPEAETKAPDDVDYGNLFSSEPMVQQYSGDSESENVIEETSTHDILLSDHLLEQLGMAAAAPEIDDAARRVISRLDENGFLGIGILEFAEASGLNPAHVELAVRLIKTFDPIGVGAMDLRETLLIQLKHRGEERSIAWRIVSDFLTELAENRLPAIAKAIGTGIEQVKEALGVIRSLDPRPGRAFGVRETNYITPDVIVEKVHGEYIVSLRQDRIPNLRVSDYYRRLFEKEKRSKGEVSEYLKGKLESAYWLIKSIEQRQSTIYRVSDSIVRHQNDFLEYGPKYLKPMVLRVIAEDLGIHESTVSRVTTQKYIQTPRGTFELKYFFTSSIETQSGEDASSRSVKMILQELVAAEDKKNPWSDQKFTELLSERGINIARRTVTKYREQLNILSAKQRIVY